MQQIAEHRKPLTRPHFKHFIIPRTRERGIRNFGTHLKN